MSKGAVSSDDLFPQPSFYDKTPPAKEKKLPTQEISDVLSLQDGDIGLIIIQKRKTGGFLAVSQVLLESKKDLKRQLNLAQGRVRKLFLNAVKREQK